MSPLTITPLTTELALLGFLTEKPVHGYEIFRRMSDPMGPGAVWHIKQSQLYALLNRMETEGLITGELQEQPNRPQRRQYSLTPAGLKVFTAWLVEPVKNGRNIRLDFMLKLHFARQQTPPVAVLLIEAQKEACQKWLNMQKIPTGRYLDGSLEATARSFRASQLKAMIDWLDEIHQEILQHPQNQPT
jgi:PadR family transcriptional regulator, regulatory protein AphA